MDTHGNIYELTGEQRAKLLGELSEESAQLREDTGRLDGYRRAFREALDALGGAERHPGEKLREPEGDSEA